MRKSHWILVGFMLFNTACVVESAFPGWSALYASAREAAGCALECVAAVTDHWVNRHGIYFPTYPEFEFIAWSEAVLYLTLGLLVRLLVKSELALRALRRERLEREMREARVTKRVSAPGPSGGPRHAETEKGSPKAPALSSGRARRAAAPAPGAVSVVRKKAPGGHTSATDIMTEEEWQRAVPVDATGGRLGVVISIAIDKGCWLVFDYDDLRSNHTRRRVKPLRVMSYREELYMQGFCCLRGEERTFKLSRMDSVWVVPDLRAERKGA